VLASEQITIRKIDGWRNLAVSYVMSPDTRLKGRRA
jgi:hypothetical protein